MQFRLRLLPDAQSVAESSHVLFPSCIRRLRTECGDDGARRGHDRPARRQLAAARTQTVRSVSMSLVGYSGHWDRRAQPTVRTDRKLLVRTLGWHRSRGAERSGVMPAPEPLEPIRQLRAPPFLLYASCVNGLVYRLIRKGPASTGSNPASRINSAATRLSLFLSPQYTRLDRRALRLASYTARSTSLGTV